MTLPTNGTDTSDAAARSMARIAPIIRRRVLELIRDRTQTGFGATCDEVETALKLPHQTASARIRELAKAGDIRDSGNRRLTRSNRKATVWAWTGRK